MQLKENRPEFVYSAGYIKDFFKNEYLNEALYLNLGNGLDCKIVVNGNEGPIPHFHIVGKCPSKVKGNKGNFQCCPCLYIPVYFNHAEYQDKLSNKQKEKLNIWLMQKSTIDERVFIGTNWQLLCFYWKVLDNSLINIPKNPIQPDYTKLENMRG